MKGRAKTVEVRRKSDEDFGCSLHSCPIKEQKRIMSSFLGWRLRLISPLLTLIPILCAHSV